MKGIEKRSLVPLCARVIPISRVPVDSIMILEGLSSKGSVSAVQSQRYLNCSCIRISLPLSDWPVKSRSRSKRSSSATRRHGVDLEDQLTEEELCVWLLIGQCNSRTPNVLACTKCFRIHELFFYSERHLIGLSSLPIRTVRASNLKFCRGQKRTYYSNSTTSLRRFHGEFRSWSSMSFPYTMSTSKRFH